MSHDSTVGDVTLDHSSTVGAVTKNHFLNLKGNARLEYYSQFHNVTPESSHLGSGFTNLS